MASHLSLARAQTKRSQRRIAIFAEKTERLRHHMLRVSPCMDEEQKDDKSQAHP